MDLDSLPSGLVDFRVDGGAAAAGSDSSGALIGGMKLSLRDGAGIEHPWVWDGLNDVGVPVSSGSYTIRLVHQELGAPIVIKTEGVVLLQSPSDSVQRALASALVGPNPVHESLGGPGPAIYWTPFPGASGLARVYNLAGELVAQGVDENGTGRLGLPLQRLASGVYVADFSVRQGVATLGHRPLKLVLIR